MFISMFAEHSFLIARRSWFQSQLAPLCVEFACLSPLTSFFFSSKMHQSLIGGSKVSLSVKLSVCGCVVLRWSKTLGVTYLCSAVVGKVSSDHITLKEIRRV